MDLQSAIQVITAIEAQHDVNGLRFGHFRVWPLLRSHIWAQLLQPGSQASPSGSPEPWQALPRWLRWRLRRLKNGRTMGSQRQALGQAGPIEVALFSSTSYYTDFLAQKAYNRHLDPLIELLNPQWSWVKLELRPPGSGQTCPRYYAPLVLNAEPFIKEYRDRYPAYECPRMANQLAAIAQEFDLTLNLGQFWRTAHNVLVYAAYFGDIVLPRLQPKAAVVVCYYWPVLMAFILACRQHGIPTVDVQHGKQGKWHFGYTHWTRVPVGGYELLPDYFWCWGQTSVAHIQTTMSGNSGAHVPLVGGNLWLAKWLQAPAATLLEATPDALTFCQSLASAPKVILVSLQPFADVEAVFPGHLLTVIQQTQPQWTWLIRLHPHQHPQLPYWLAYLEQHQIETHLLRPATYYPLYGLLRYCHYHVTCWSSVSYEALALGVPTIVIHPTGQQLYHCDIEARHFAYADTAAALVEALQRSPNEFNFKEQNPYIETHPAIARQAVNQILKGDR